MTDHDANNDPDLDVSADLSGSYITKADVEAGPLTFRIAAVERKQFEAREGRAAEKKIVLTLEGDPVRRMGLNRTNLETLSDAWGTKAGRWVGKVFDAYWDPTVLMRGKRSGGIRVRVRELTIATPPAVPAQAGRKKKAAEPAATAASEADDVPF